MDIGNKLVVEAGHVTEAYGPVQAARNYLINKAGEYINIEHPFSYCGLKGTVVEKFKNGKCLGTEQGHKRCSNPFIQWAGDYSFNIRYLKSLKRKIDVMIAVDNLNAVAGTELKKAGVVDTLVYYIIDHMDRRFRNPVFNYIYEKADKISCVKSDYIWSLSDRIADAKEKRFSFDRDKNLIVPVGIELEKIEKFPEEEKLKKKTLVFMGVLDETKGVQLMIDAMKEIAGKAAGAELIIIGTGPYETQLRKKTDREGLSACVKFMGPMAHDEIFKFIPRHRIGLAPYNDDPGSYTYYADPTKPKEYLGCGLPLIITDVPWVAEEVGKRPMGIVCRYRKDELAAAAIKLLTDDGFYKTCLKNAYDFASGLSWDKIYDSTFEKMRAQAY